VSETTVADSMRHHGLIARRIRRRGGLTRQDKTAPKFPDLLKRDFTASAPNSRWVGDMTGIPTAAGKLYLATVLDLYSRRLLGAATGLHPDAELARAAIETAVAARGGAAPISGSSSTPWLDLHRREVHRPVPPAEHPPVHGSGRLLRRLPRPRRSSPA
jgi:putative transposase